MSDLPKWRDWLLRNDPRFWSMVRVDGECWTWTGAVGENGYGQVRRRRRVYKAHRWSYENLVGAVPEGLELDHLCRRRSCVNPAHLEPVTRAENIRRGIGPQAAQERAAAITVCPKGHRYEGANLFKRSRGSKECRECMRERGRTARLLTPARQRLMEVVKSLGDQASLDRIAAVVIGDRKGKGRRANLVSSLDSLVRAGVLTVVNDRYRHVIADLRPRQPTAEVGHAG